MFTDYVLCRNNRTTDKDPLIGRQPHGFSLFEKTLDVLNETLSREILQVFGQRVRHRRQRRGRRGADEGAAGRRRLWQMREQDLVGVVLEVAAENVGQCQHRIAG